MKRALIIVLTFVSAIVNSTMAEAKIEIKNENNLTGVFDTGTSTWIIPAKYTQIFRITSITGKGEEFYACSSNKLFALFNSKGIRTTDFTFDYIFDRYINGMFRISLHEYNGMVDKDGNIVLPAEYRSIGIQDNGDVRTLDKENHWETISASDLDDRRKQALASGNKYSCYKDANEWAVKISEFDHRPEKSPHRISETGGTLHFTVRNLSSIDMGPCINGFFTVQDREAGCTYLFDKSCKLLSTSQTLPPTVIFDREGTALVETGDKSVSLIRTDGSVKKRYENVAAYSSMQEGIGAILTWDGDFCIIDPDGNAKLKCKRTIDSSGNPIMTDLSGREMDYGLLGALDWVLKEKNIFFDVQDYGKIEFHPEHEGMRICAIGPHYTQKYGFVDPDFSVVIPAKFDGAHDFSEGLAAVAVKEGNGLKWGFIDKTGSYVISPKFSIEPGNFSDGYAVVQKRDGGYCYIDRTGNVVKQGFSSASSFYEGYAFVNSLSNNTMVVDTSFNLVGFTALRSYLLLHRKEGHFFNNGGIWSPTGEALVSRSGITNSGYIVDSNANDLYPCIDGGKTGYANIKGEWCIVFNEDEF